MSLVSKGDRVAIKSGATCQIKSELLQMNRTGTYSPVLLSMILSVSMSMSRSAGAPSSPKQTIPLHLLSARAGWRPVGTKRIRQGDFLVTHLSLVR